MCSIQWLGDGQLNSAFGLVNTLVKPRSNLVNPGQTWSNLPKLWEMHSGPRLEVLLMWWAPVGSDRLGQTSVKLGQPWSNLVKLGRPSSNSEKCAPGPVLRFFWCGGSLSGLAGSIQVISFCVPTPEKIQGIKIRLWQLALSPHDLCTLPMMGLVHS